MSVHIDEVLDYLDKNLICQRSEDMPSLMAALREAYLLYDTGEETPAVTAFSQGVLTGMMLMTEVKWMP